MSVVGEYLRSDNARPGMIVRLSGDMLYQLIEPVGSEWRATLLHPRRGGAALAPGHNDLEIVAEPVEGPKGKAFDILAEAIHRHARQRKWCDEYMDFVGEVDALLAPFGVKMPPYRTTRVVVEMDIGYDWDESAVTASFRRGLEIAGYDEQQIRRIGIDPVEEDSRF